MKNVEALGAWAYTLPTSDHAIIIIMIIGDTIVDIIVMMRYYTAIKARLRKLRLSKACNGV